MALVFFVVLSALVLHFARSGRDGTRLLALAVSTGLVFAVVSLWIGWQLPPKGAGFEGDASRVSTWILASGVALYALGPFLQIYQVTGTPRFPYSEL
jgi:hypothetical protein